MKNRKALLLLICTVLWTAFIFARSMQPASVSDQESGCVLALAERVVPGMSMTLLRKIAHFVEFFVLGGLLAATCHRLCGRLPLMPLLAGLVTALCDETIQLVTPGRSGRVTDVWIDFSGVLLAVLAGEILRRIRRRREKS